jgi:dinuclear metal center YbgI/SA1388 family protein
MICSEIIKEIEDWAPKETAWQKDNVGLQVGSLNRKVKNILLCLELNDNVLDEAIKKNCSLVITHHPLLFHPLKRIDVDSDANSLLVEKLIKNDVTLYSAHTNLDYTKNGVSFVLAGTLRLNNIKFLDNLKSNQYKLSVFVPADSVEELAGAIFSPAVVLLEIIPAAVSGLKVPVLL